MSTQLNDGGDNINGEKEKLSMEERLQLWLAKKKRKPSTSRVPFKTLQSTTISASSTAAKRSLDKHSNGTLKRKALSSYSSNGSDITTSDSLRQVNYPKDTSLGAPGCNTPYVEMNEMLNTSKTIESSIPSANLEKNEKMGNLPAYTNKENSIELSALSLVDIDLLKDLPSPTRPSSDRRRRTRISDRNAISSRRSLIPHCDSSAVLTSVPPSPPFIAPYEEGLTESRPSGRDKNRIMWSPLAMFDDRTNTSDFDCYSKSVSEGENRVVEDINMVSCAGFPSLNPSTSPKSTGVSTTNESIAEQPTSPRVLPSDLGYCSTDTKAQGMMMTSEIYPKVEQKLKETLENELVALRLEVTELRKKEKENEMEQDEWTDQVHEALRESLEENRRLHNAVLQLEETNTLLTHDISKLTSDVSYFSSMYQMATLEASTSHVYEKVHYTAPCVTNEETVSDILANQQNPGTPSYFNNNNNDGNDEPQIKTCISNNENRTASVKIVVPNLEDDICLADARERTVLVAAIDELIASARDAVQESAALRFSNDLLVLQVNEAENRVNAALSKSEQGAETLRQEHADDICKWQELIREHEKMIKMLSTSLTDMCEKERKAVQERRALEEALLLTNEQSTSP